jgi:hypothetical protein
VGALVQIIASAVGGLIAGYFVVVGVTLQFRRHSKAALCALMAEVADNKDAAADMARSLAGTQTFEAGHPDPGWLKHSIWDSQLPYAVQLFDDGAMLMVRRAYSLLDAVPAMVIPQGVIRPPGSSCFARGR